MLGGGREGGSPSGLGQRCGAAEGQVGGLGVVRRSQAGCHFHEGQLQGHLSRVPRRWTSSPLILFFWK